MDHANASNLARWSSSAPTTAPWSAALGERGIRAVGVDLAPNITEMARERGLDVITGAFATELAPELRDAPRGEVDLVTGSNVFAHNDDPARFSRRADAVLAPDGVLCLEVMYAGDLLDQLQWDTLYHEHLTFYSLGTLDSAARAIRLRAGRRRADPDARRLAAARCGA